LDEIIAIIETEKVKVDIRSGMAGTLSNLFAKEGDTVAVGKPLYEVDDAGKKPEVAAKPEPAETQTSPKPTSKPAPPPPAESKPKPATKPQSGAAASKSKNK
jgi:2-oxoglutarate dehydrogenase E2 component (dihydrolipoamide succinyltransferase)